MPLSRPFWDLAFRPFFLLAALSAVLLVPVWVAMWAGWLPASGYMYGYDWHIHEMVFGFAAAVLAGFLLTATRNWTKRPTASGGGLAALALLWTSGRAVVLLADWLPGGLVATVDLAFLPLVAAVLMRPIVAAKSWRNIALPPLLLLLALANAAMHGKALGLTPVAGLRAPLVAVDLVLVFLVVVGTRIIPLFTANAIEGLTIRRWALADRLAPWLLALLAVVHASPAPVEWAGGCALVGGLVVAAQMRGWGGLRTRGRPILWVLHLGYTWLALGLLLLALSSWSSLLPRAAAVHALTAGALGTLTFGMMSRVSLGHSGRKLEVSGAVTAAYVLLQLAAAVRVLMATVGGPGYRAALVVSSALWASAFALFLVVYLPILWGPRADGTRDWRRSPEAG